MYVEFLLILPPSSQIFVLNRIHLKSFNRSALEKSAGNSVGSFFLQADSTGHVYV